MGPKFATVEHGYHYRKFSETAPQVAKAIMDAPSPWATFQLSREFTAQRRTDWDDVKVDIMRELLVAKLDQNEDVRERLKATGTKTIYEHSPWDDFWGIGPGGKGQNTMGRLWMDLRDEMIIDK